jgi:hypothetical protein
LANNVIGVYLTQVSLLLIGQLGLVDSFRYRPLIPIDWSIVQILHQRQRKTTNTAPTTLSEIQASCQSTFINEQSYSLAISWNDKNMQVTLLSQLKLALPTINKLYAL